MTKTVWQIFFDFKCPLCRLSKKVQGKKNAGSPGIFMHYFSGTSSLLLCSFVPGSMSDLFGTPRCCLMEDMCRLQQSSSSCVCSCICFLSLLPLLHVDAVCLCQDITATELSCSYQPHNSLLLRNSCSCSFQDVTKECLETWFGKQLTLLLLCACSAQRRSSVCVWMSAWRI